MKNSTPAERRKAQEVIEAMAAEVGADYFVITKWPNGRYTIDAMAVKQHKGIGETLDDAFTALLHRLAGTEPPPF